MTVSPRRAQDGERQPFATHQGVESVDRGPFTLPPTLFKLPNLNRSKDLVSASPTTAPDSAPVQISTTTESAPDPPSPPAARPPAPSPNPETPRERSTIIPAGRLWMEKIGSHSLVLLMLLIVVAAALFTGRGSSDPSQLDDSVAHHASHEIDFDVQHNASLPLPAHSHLPGTVDLAAQTQIPADTDVIANRSATGVEGQSWIDESPQYAATQYGAEQLGGAVVFPASEHSTSVALDAPAATYSEPVAPSSEPNRSASSIATVGAPIEANEFFDRSSTIDATTVSNRTAIDDAFSVPTLEELESGNVAVAPTPTLNTPHFSKTPFGITIPLPPLTTPTQAARPDSVSEVITPSSFER